MQRVAEAVGVAVITGAYQMFAVPGGSALGDILSLQGGLGCAAGYIGAKMLTQGQSTTIMMAAPLAGAVAVPALMGAGVNPVYVATAYVGSMVGVYVYSKLSSKGGEAVSASY